MVIDVLVILEWQLFVIDGVVYTTILHLHLGRQYYTFARAEAAAEVVPAWRVCPDPSQCRARIGFDSTTPRFIA